MLLMMFLIGAFGLNFPIFISTMSATAFHVGPAHYGALTSAMAIGAVVAALFAATRADARITHLFAAATIFAVGCALAAVMPNFVLFGMVLVVIGMATQTFITSINSLVQLSAEPALRGRMVALLFAAAIGGNPIGAPIVGWVADTAGPRAALMIGAAAGFAAAGAALGYFVRHAGLRVRIQGRCLTVTFADKGAGSASARPSPKR